MFSGVRVCVFSVKSLSILLAALRLYFSTFLSPPPVGSVEELGGLVQFSSRHFVYLA